MKSVHTLTSAIAFAASTSFAFAADAPPARPECAMMKPPTPPPSCACCEKMEKKDAPVAAAPTLEQLIA